MTGPVKQVRFAIKVPIHTASRVSRMACFVGLGLGLGLALGLVGIGLWLGLGLASQASRVYLRGMSTHTTG